MKQNNRTPGAEKVPSIAKRFRGMLPIVVDVETAGLRAETDALLEVAAVMLKMDTTGKLSRGETIAFHVEPFPGGVIMAEALEINHIDPWHPFRFAIPEEQAMHRLFQAIREQLEKTECYRAVLVGHNAWFDLSFILAAARRSQIQDIPFHTFTTLDTASLASVAFGESVLARAMRRARISFDVNEAHSAIYDAEKTAELFCCIANRWGGV